MKKVCHVTSAHPPEDGRIFRRACTSAVNAGYDTYLVQIGESYDKNGVHIVGVGKPAKSGRVYRMTSFAKATFQKALSVDADLYLLHDPELLPYVAKLKKRGKAVVFDSHENYVEQIKNKPYLPKIIASAVSSLFKLYSRSVFKKLDGLTYAGNGETQTVFDSMCSKVVPTDNLPWLNELYEKYDSSIRKEQRSACYIGGLDEVRGITQAIKACYHAKCKLYLAGQFHSELYKAQIMAMPEYSCVEYLGVINRNEVLRLLQKVEVGICTLLDIGQYYKMLNLPTKVYEYMSLSLPVILNDSPYNKKIVDEIQFGFCVNPIDIESYSKALDLILEDESLRAEMGKKGREAIKNRYSWDSAQLRLIEMYKAILGE